ncbi:hypothetical protein ACVIRO_003729 [Rhizobium ruizarguesonis]
MNAAGQRRGPAERPDIVRMQKTGRVARFFMRGWERLGVQFVENADLPSSGCRHQPGSSHGSRPFLRFSRGEVTCRNISIPSSPLGEKVPVGRMRGAREAGLSYNTMRVSTALASFRSCSGRSRSACGIGYHGKSVPCGPLIRLPAPSPRGEKRFAAIAPFPTNLSQGTSPRPVYGERVRVICARFSPGHKESGCDSSFG